MERAFQEIDGKYTPLLRFTKHGKYRVVYGLRTVTGSQLQFIEKTCPGLQCVVLFSRTTPSDIVAVVTLDKDIEFNPEDVELQLIPEWGAYVPPATVAKFPWEDNLKDPVFAEQAPMIRNVQGALGMGGTIRQVEVLAEQVAVHADVLFFTTDSFYTLLDTKGYEDASCILGSLWKEQRAASMVVTASRQKNLLAHMTANASNGVKRVLSRTRTPVLRGTHAHLIITGGSK
jgi:hypothetical protein